MSRRGLDDPFGPTWDDIIVEREVGQITCPVCKHRCNFEGHRDSSVRRWKHVVMIQRFECPCNCHENITALVGERVWCDECEIHHECFTDHGPDGHGGSSICCPRKRERVRSAT